jgi:hypothetical protein
MKTESFRKHQSLLIASFRNALHHRPCRLRVLPESRTDCDADEHLFKPLKERSAQYIVTIYPTHSVKSRMFPYPASSSPTLQDY